MVVPSLNNFILPISFLGFKFMLEKFKAIMYCSVVIFHFKIQYRPDQVA